MPFNFQAQRLPTESVNPYNQALTTGLNRFQEIQSAANLPEQLRSELLKTHLENLKSQAELPYVETNAKATAEYKDAMARYLSQPNQQLRYLSPLGKSFVEPAISSAILKSQGQNPPIYNNPQLKNQGLNSITNEEIPKIIKNENEIVNDKNDPVFSAYAQQRLKNITDPSARQKTLYALNVEKTLKGINPQDLTRYSGIGGIGQKIVESAKSGFGKGSEEYKKYDQAKEASGLLAQQVRQFYGSSIQPKEMQRIQDKLSPSAWDRDPKQAADVFKKITDILKTELQTYYNALGSAKGYQPEQEMPNNQESDKGSNLDQIDLGQNGQAKIEATKNLGNQNYVKINGKWYQQ